MNTDNIPLVLTIDEAAEILRLKRSTAYELAKKGKLPTIKIGRQVRVTRSDLLKLIKLE